jgi:hypothetical protein
MSPVKRTPAPKTAAKPMTAGDCEQDRLRIFRRLKALLEPYEKKLTKRSDFEGRYELWSEKALVVAGRPRREIQFAALIIQSAYVGFYFMPVYAQASLAEVFKPELLKLLKGKSCFRIKALDAGLERAVAAALKKGFALYKKRGWV